HRGRSCENADLGQIFGGEIVDEARRPQRSGARHVLWDDARIAGDEAAEVAREGASISVVTAARPVADLDCDGFAFEVDRLLRRRRPGKAKEPRQGEKTTTKPRHGLHLMCRTADCHFSGGSK